MANNMTIEEAIRKAVEGGWRSAYYRSVLELNPNNKVGVHPVVRSSLTHLEIFLDPAFWQSLGKAIGWGIDEIEGRFWKAGMDGKKEAWLAQWHRFIDHLAEGKKAEDWFAELKP